MNDKTQFKVKVEGPGINIDREVSTDFAKKVILAVLNDSSSFMEASANSKSRTESPPSSEPKGMSDGKPELSIREFFDNHKPKRNVDKIASIGLYLREYQDVGKFSKEDVVHWFEKAAEPVPGNVPRDLRWAVKNGWIASTAGDEDLYYLTNKGEDVVNANFPEEVIKSTSVNR